MKRILFVDDEPKVLEGLRRMLHGLRREWEMCFAESGREALARMAESSFDVVVTDMRMPGLDGGELLREVRARYPATVRIVLSGQCDRETVLRAVGPTHQFLTKPCESQALKAAVARACALRDRLPDEHTQRVVSRVQTLPVQTEVYAEVKAELSKPGPSMQRLGELLSGDAACTLRVLQLVNSGFFGTPRRVSDAAHAANLLGVDTLRALGALSRVCRPLDAASPLAPLCGELFAHSSAVARAARRIALAQTGERTLAGDAFTAGLLHDVGVLVTLGACDPGEDGPEEQWRCLDAAARHLAKEEQNTTHADVGAYLTALWGLPDAVVEAVAHHHSPGRGGQGGFTALTAVHVADALLRAEHGTLIPEFQTPLDEQYLEHVGLAGWLDAWREAALAEEPLGVSV